MSWTAPRTWVTGEVLTASLNNTHVRDNLIETAPAKVTTKGDVLAATAANAIARVAVGANGTFLEAASGETAGVRWATQIADATFLTTTAHAGLSAEVVVTAPSSNGVVPVVVFKASDETVNNSAVLQDDDDILWTVGANEKWAFMLLPFFNSSAVADIKLGMAASAGAFTDSRWGSSNATAAPGIASAQILAGVGFDKLDAAIWGYLEKDGTGGSVKLQWAQNTAEVSDTKLLTGTYLIAWKLS